MSTFTPYYNDNLRTWVNTVGQDNIVKRVPLMDVPELDTFKDDIVQECRVDPSFEHTHGCIVACRAMMRRYQEFKRLGVQRQVQVGPPLTFGNIFLAAVKGIIIGDVVSDVIIGSQKKAAAEEDFRKEILRKLG